MLQIIGIKILHDDLCTRASIYFHFETFILIISRKGVTGDVQFLEADKVTSTDQIVLILNLIEREIQLHQRPEVTCCQLLSVDSPYFVTSHRYQLNSRKCRQTSPKLRSFVVWSEIVAFQIDVFKQSEVF